jgi:hypothetical protein
MKRSREWRRKRREWHRKRYASVLAKIRAVKLERGCKDCGYREYAVALAFDHLPGSHKSFNLSQWSTGHPTWEEIEAEIAKCEVVCHNCHAVRGEKRRELQRRKQ